MLQTQTSIMQELLLHHHKVCNSWVDITNILLSFLVQEIQHIQLKSNWYKECKLKYKEKEFAFTDHVNNVCF